MDEGSLVWKPKFFRKLDHPHITNEMLTTREEKPVYYQLIENEGDDKGYWERRETGDWDDLPNLWGPFPKE